MDLEAIFEFVCENPPTAMIGGGILFFLIGSLLMPFYPQSSSVLFAIAPWLLVGGFVLQILWLFIGVISDLLTQ